MLVVTLLSSLLHHLAEGRIANYHRCYAWPSKPRVAGSNPAGGVGWVGWVNEVDRTGQHSRANPCNRREHELHGVHQEALSRRIATKHWTWTLVREGSRLWIR